MANLIDFNKPERNPAIITNPLHLEIFPEYTEVRFMIYPREKASYNTNETIELDVNGTGEKQTFKLCHIMSVTATDEGVFLDALIEAAETMPEEEKKSAASEVISLAGYKKEYER